MSFKFIFLLIIFIDFIANEFMDTDCYKSAGSSVKDCKVLTTFINGTEDNYEIEENVLFMLLC